MIEYPIVTHPSPTQCGIGPIWCFAPFGRSILSTFWPYWFMKPMDKHQQIGQRITAIKKSLFLMYIHSVFYNKSMRWMPNFWSGPRLNSFEP